MIGITLLLAVVYLLATLDGCCGRLCDFSSIDYDVLHQLYNDTNGEHWSWKDQTTAATPAIASSDSRITKQRRFQLSAAAVGVTVPWNFTGNDNNNPCVESWQGVTCGYMIVVGSALPQCYVESLLLPQMNLTGRLPADINKLSLLVELNLENNSLSNSLPSFVGMNQLNSIQLNDNYLIGPFPNEVFSLPKMASISFHQNMLTGLICLGNLSTTVVSIYLYSNDFHSSFDMLLQGISADKPYQLQYLSVESMNIYGTIPSSLCYFSQLYFFSAAINAITGTLPSCLASLSSLSEFDVISNQLHGTIPSGIWNLTTLEYFAFSQNMIFDNISTYFPFPLPRLATLEMNYNRLYGSLPAAVSHLTNLATFDAAANDITGSIPEALYNLTSLLYLDLSLNPLGGSVSDSIGKLHHILKISLSGSQLTGTIPSTLGKLSRLNLLYLGTNGLHGPIPSSLGNLSLLTELYINNNLLTGSIPLSIYHMETLQAFGASGNPLTHSFPPRIPRWSHLYFLSLGGTNMYGNLSAVCDLPNLQELYLGNNFLTGRLPGCVPTNLRAIQLYLNYLTASIPLEMFQLPMLYDLQVFSNSLTGDLSAVSLISPNVFAVMIQQNYLTGTLDSLVVSLQLSAPLVTYLDVSSNYFSGTIPSALGELQAVTQLRLGSNCFHGYFPTSLCQLSALEQLSMNGLTASCQIQETPDLSVLHTYFTAYLYGSLPNCLFELPHLAVMKLSGNGIRGTLPAAIGSNLTQISLSNNRLSSTIPAAFQSSNIAYLDLSYNYLNGTLDGFSGNGYIQPSNTLYLQSNRLSGAIPTALLAIDDINILTANLFSCSSELPPNDPSYGAYICGSATLNVSLIAFGALLLVCGAIAGWGYVALHEPGSAYKDWIASIQSSYRRYTHWAERLRQFDPIYVGQTTVACRHTGLYLAALRNIRWNAAILTALIVVFGSVVYPILKSSYRTVTYQYGWTVSAAYMSGDIPAAVIEVMFLALSVVVMTVVTRQYLSDRNRYQLSDSPHRISHIPSPSPSHGEKRSWTSYATVALYGLAIIGNCAAVITANVVYSMVYIESNDSTVVFLTRALLAMFQIGWNLCVIPLSLTTLNSELRYFPERMCGYLTVIYFFNDVIVPCVASMMALDSCFKNIFIGFQSISTFYSWTSVVSVTIEGKIFDFETTVTEAVSFQPPFIYSGQCSSGIISAYIPVYMLNYLFQIVLIPALYLILGSCATYEDMSSFIQPMLPTILWPSIRTVARGYPVKVHNILASLIVDFGVLLTIGLIDPPLAVIACGCIAVKTIVKEMVIGRYISLALEEHSLPIAVSVMEPLSDSVTEAIRSRLGCEKMRTAGLILHTPCEGNLNRLKAHPLVMFELACANMWAVPQSCMWLIVLMAAPLYASLCFDVAQQSTSALAWILPLNGLLVLSYFVTAYCSRDTPKVEILIELKTKATYQHDFTDEFNTVSLASSEAF